MNWFLLVFPLKKQLGMGVLCWAAIAESSSAYHAGKSEARRWADVLLELRSSNIQVCTDLSDEDFERDCKDRSDEEVIKTCSKCNQAGELAPALAVLNNLDTGSCDQTDETKIREALEDGNPVGVLQDRSPRDIDHYLAVVGVSGIEQNEERDVCWIFADSAGHGSARLQSGFGRWEKCVRTQKAETEPGGKRIKIDDCLLPSTWAKIKRALDIDKIDPHLKKPPKALFKALEKMTDDFGHRTRAEELKRDIRREGITRFLVRVRASPALPVYRMDASETNLVPERLPDTWRTLILENRKIVAYIDEVEVRGKFSVQQIVLGDAVSELAGALERFTEKEGELPDARNIRILESPGLHLEILVVGRERNDVRGILLRTPDLLPISNPILKFDQLERLIEHAKSLTPP